MKSIYSTGDVAYYATMIELVGAIKSCNIMLSKPNKMHERLVELLQDSIMESAPYDVKQMMMQPEYRAAMSELRGYCGLSVMSVLQCLNRCERGMQKLNAVS